MALANMVTIVFSISINKNRRSRTTMTTTITAIVTTSVETVDAGLCRLPYTCPPEASGCWHKLGLSIQLPCLRKRK